MKTEKNFSAQSLWARRRQRDEMRRMNLHLSSRYEEVDRTSDDYSSPYKGEEREERLHNAMRHVM